MYSSVLTVWSVLEPDLWARRAAQKFCLWSIFTPRPVSGSEHHQARCLGWELLVGRRLLLANFLSRSAVQRDPNRCPFEVEVFVE